MLEDRDAEYLRLESSSKFKPTDFSKDLQLLQKYQDAKTLGITSPLINDSDLRQTEYESSHNESFRHVRGGAELLNSSIASGSRLFTNSK